MGLDGPIRTGTGWSRGSANSRLPAALPEVREPWRMASAPADAVVYRRDVDAVTEVLDRDSIQGRRSLIKPISAGIKNFQEGLLHVLRSVWDVEC